MSTICNSRALVLFLAQGFGSGRIPWAPGTWGTLVGLGWLALLLWAANPVIFGLGLLLSIPLSVWACGQAEKILGKADPGSVVLDEIIAVPVCFLAWLGWIYWKKGVWPGAGYFFSPSMIGWTLGVFLLFRLFDIWKPWPVGKSQDLPGGWGVTCDDLLAAVYVNVATLPLLYWRIH